MLRCCKYCGALLEAETKVCEFCGKALESPQPEPTPEPEPVVQEAVPELTTEEPSPAPKKKLSKRTLWIAGAALIAVIALVLAIVLPPLACLTAVQTYEDIINGDYADLKDLAPQEYWELAVAGSSTTVDTYLRRFTDRLKDQAEQSREKLEQFYGKDHTVSIKIVEHEKVSTDDLNGIRDYLEENFGISPNRIKSAYNLILKLTRKGTEYSRSVIAYVAAVQIDSQWYLIEYSARATSDGIKYYVAFNVAQVLWALNS